MSKENRTTYELVRQATYPPILRDKDRGDEWVLGTVCVFTLAGVLFGFIGGEK